MISKRSVNLLLTIVFGVVGLVLSYGFFIPPELSMFRLIAAIGMMVGYQLGQLVARLVRPSPKRFLVLSVSAVLCFFFAFAYASMIQMRSANASDIVNLGALLGLCFLSLGFLLPFTGIFVPNELEILWSRAIEYFARLFRGYANKSSPSSRVPLVSVIDRSMPGQCTPLAVNIGYGFSNATDAIAEKLAIPDAPHLLVGFAGVFGAIGSELVRRHV